MTDEQMAPRLESGKQIVHDAGLGFRVEIDHHIAQENDVEITDSTIDRVSQIDLVESDALPQFRGNEQRAFMAAYAFTQQSVI